MSTLGWFVFQSRRQACDQLIEFLSTHPEHPRRTREPPPDDPLDQRASPHAVVQLLARLAQPEHADGLRALAEDAALDPSLRSHLYEALVRVAEVPSSTRRIVFGRYVAELAGRAGATPDRFSSHAWHLARVLASDSSPAALREAERVLDRLEPAARVAVLSNLPNYADEPVPEATTHLLAHFAERFWLCDRPALEAAGPQPPALWSNASSLVEQFALATADVDRRSRELLFETWAREPDNASRTLLGEIEGLPGFVDYVAARPALLARAARDFRLPARVLIEHFGPAGLVRRIESTVRMTWAKTGDDHGWAFWQRADHAIRVLATLPDGARVACGLLAEYCQQPCIDPRAEYVDSSVQDLVDLLWSHDPEQTLALGRSAAERSVRGALVRSAVLACIAKEPAPAHRDELMRALRNGRTLHDTWTAIQALESLGERGPEWLAALRKEHPDEGAWRRAERAAVLMGLGDADAERDLARMARGTGDEARAAAERGMRALAPRVANHRALFEWIVLARPLAHCPCCDRDAGYAITALGTLGDEAVRTTVFRAAVRACEDTVTNAAAAVLTASS